MKILAVETSAVAAGAALLEDGKIISESYLNTGLNHSATMMQLVDSALNNAGQTLSNVDALAVAAGPGSFTGIRIGVSAIKGLAFTNNTPCFAVSTLEALAYCVNLEGFLICPVMDARCNQVYTALFEKKGDILYRIYDDKPLKLDELYDRLLQYPERKIMFIGDGTDLAYRYFSSKKLDICKFSEIFKYQHASGVAFAAYNMYNKGIEPVSAEKLLPVYLRLSQAEREYNKRRS